MKKLKRTLIILSAISLAFSSCEPNLKNNKTSNNTPLNSKNTSSKKDMRDISSSELVKEIKIGWCLGNTLDSTLGYSNGSSAEYETGWGNEITTPEMIQGIADSGFNIIRIPVSWGEHISDDGKYTIDADWMNRVNEIVDYSLNAGLFVILNTHHEEWLYPDYEHFEQNAECLRSLWIQIGNRFEGYNEKLIFEGINEPRKRGTNVEWNGGDTEGQEVVNKLNAVFVETIRGLDGNNPKRHLMIPTYAASCSPNAINSIEIPENDDKIIVSIHAYIPYLFALSDNGIGEWSSEDPSCTQEIDQLMSTLKSRFVDNGTPVIIGEMGAVNRNNLEARADWCEYYIRCAKNAGIPCLWWDNGTYLGDGELFGIYSRKSGKWIFNDVLDGLMKGLE